MHVGLFNNHLQKFQLLVLAAHCYMIIEKKRVGGSQRKFYYLNPKMALSLSQNQKRILFAAGNKLFNILNVVK